MSFRERPEYQEWRDAVFRTFGRQCILCGHTGNITAHHVMAVNTYPELAFEPTNGVPLCGNCHAAVNGNEAAYVNDLRRRQEAFVNRDLSHHRPELPSESELKSLALADPANGNVVAEWFITPSSDPEEVVAFYNEHHSQFAKNAMLYIGLACKLLQLKRHDDTIRVTDAAARCAKKEGMVEECASSIARLGLAALLESGRTVDAEELVAEFRAKHSDQGGPLAELYGKLAHHLVACKRVSEALENLKTACTCAAAAGRLGDYIDGLAETARCAAWYADDHEPILKFLENSVRQLPDHAELHYLYSQVLYDHGPKDTTVTEEPMLAKGMRRIYSEGKPPQESLMHAYTALELDPTNRAHLDWACEISDSMCDFRNCHKLLNHRVETAESDEEIADALLALADFYCDNRFFSEGISAYRRVLAMGDGQVSDETKSQALSRLAYIQLESGTPERANKYASKALLYDPHNVAAKSILEREAK
jgi:tetratricopeptide (TPR) repeat protein